MATVVPIGAKPRQQQPSRLQVSFGDDPDLRRALMMMDALADILPRLAAEEGQNRASLNAVVLAYAQPLIDQLNATRIRGRRHAVND